MTVSDGVEARKIARTHPALTDAQTGLANRLHFDLIYNYLFDAGERGLPFVVMMVSAGMDASTTTEEIRQVGQQIRGAIRSSDLASHLGQGRYVVLLLGANAPSARIAADRVEGALADIAPGPISFGLATYTRDVEDSESLLRSADTALLAAQALGGGVQYG